MYTSDLRATTTIFLSYLGIHIEFYQNVLNTIDVMRLRFLKFSFILKLYSGIKKFFQDFWQNISFCTLLIEIMQRQNVIFVFDFYDVNF